MKLILERKLQETKREYRVCRQRGFIPEAKNARRNAHAIIKQLNILRQGIG